MLSDDEYRDEVATRVLQELVAHWVRDSGHLAPFPSEANAKQAFDIAEALVTERSNRRAAARLDR